MDRVNFVICVHTFSFISVFTAQIQQSSATFQFISYAV